MDGIQEGLSVGFIQAPHLEIFPVGVVAVATHKVGVPQTEMSFRVIGVDPYRIVKCLQRLLGSSHGLIDVADIFETFGLVGVDAQ